MTEEIKTKIEETKTNAKEKVTNFMLRHEKLFYGVAAVGAIFGIGYSVGRAKTKGVVRKELREEIGHWTWRERIDEETNNSTVTVVTEE